MPLVLGLTAGCAPSLGTAAANADVPARALVRLSATRAVAARATDAGVAVIGFREQDGAWISQVIASSQQGGPVLVQLMTLDGETGEEWNSFVYGRADERVSRVVLVGLAGSGGQVIDGAWVVAVREPGLAPGDLEWTFLAADGAVMQHGTGIRP